MAGRIAGLLFVLAIPVLLLSLNLRILVECQALYEHGFDRHHIAEESGIARDDLSAAAKELIAYLTGRTASAQMEVHRDGEMVSLYTQWELAHLRDVKGLIGFFYLALWVSLGYVVIYIAAGLARRGRAFLPALSRLVLWACLLYTSSPRDLSTSRMPSPA